LRSAVLVEREQQPREGEVVPPVRAEGRPGERRARDPVVVPADGLEEGPLIGAQAHEVGVRLRRVRDEVQLSALELEARLEGQGVARVVERRRVRPW
jgi:hypothetical protein